MLFMAREKSRELDDYENFILPIMVIRDETSVTVHSPILLNEQVGVTLMRTEKHEYAGCAPIVKNVVALIPPCGHPGCGNDQMIEVNLN